LFSSGWTLDDVLDLTWEQLTICIKCVVSTKAEQMTMIMDVVSRALGGKGNKKKKRKTAQRPVDEAAKERQMIDRLSAMGVPVESS